ncbi:MAG TPA: Asp-tRNA(Asn)/Glu-tRNA(Gln) amidotransferase subunit GatA [Clostridiales bacterium]|nr:Asp-tRNA(Asn)/Glu-tRNA(Gln) amidotransferase subunit GatA [Clostridiales bacterium]
MELWGHTVVEIQRMLKEKAVRVREVAEAVLHRIGQMEPSTRAYIRLCDREEILEKASAVEQRIQNHNMGELAGIPMALQDDICTDGIGTTCGAKMLEKFVPPYDAEVAKRLFEEDCILLGKTNLDAFGLGASTENSAFCPTNNPLDKKRIAGGAGGAAAAVAAGEAFFALASDTAGAVRQSASYCGLVGCKPTYGLVSRYGVITHAPSLVQIGILAKDAQDCAAVLNGIAGYDEKDGNSVVAEKIDYLEALGEGNLKGIRIGILTDDFGMKIHPVLRESVEKAADTFEILGARVESVRIPHLAYGLPVHLVIAAAECSSALARFDGIRYGYRSENVEDIEELFIKSRSEGFGKAEKIWMLLGGYLLQHGKGAERYQKALKLRAQIRKDFMQVFESFDLILAPVCPGLPPEKGTQGDEYLKMYQNYACTAVANLIGLPALSIPCGVHQGIPIGVQLMGGFFKERLLLQAAYAFEQAQGGFYRKGGGNPEKLDAQRENDAEKGAERRERHGI